MPYEDIKKEEGKVIKEKHLALYRDKEGKLHSYSSICTHEECDIAWQSEDKNWECPCHGARFTPDGHVISGPAIEPLREIE
ncbi:Rieske 2Fe-2S domain-containing protein [Patescibacteria group bacterium]|nr:Rieske 2Fe-2S domain-containing protein [Patescibacteria group bacterium]